MIDSGQPAAKEQEQATARLRAQGAAKGILDPAAVAEKLAIMAENGVASVESLTSTFTRLLPTF